MNPDNNAVASKAAANPMLSEQAILQWNDIVQGILVKSKKMDSPGALPQNETGKYIRYALDNHGRLSLGKGHGRRKVRLKPWQDAERRLTGAIFGSALGRLFRKAQASVSPGENPAPITQQDVKKAQEYAVRTAAVVMAAPAKAKSKAARKRRQMSNKINRGTVMANSNRASITHSAGR